MQRQAMAFAIATAVVMSACTPRDEPGVDDEVEAAFEETRADIGAFMSNLDDDLENLEQRAQEGAANVSAAWRNSVADLRRERNEVARELDMWENRAATATAAERRALRERVTQLSYDVQSARLEAAETREDFAEAAREWVDDIEDRLSRVDDRLNDAAVEIRAGATTEAQQVRMELEQLDEQLEAMEDDDEQQYSMSRSQVVQRITDLERRVRGIEFDLMGRHQNTTVR